MGVGDNMLIERGGLSGVVGMELVRDTMVVESWDASCPSSNRDTLARSWRPDTATDDSSADAVLVDDVAGMEKF